MKPTELRQEIRRMRFEEAYEDWKQNRLTQEEAGRILGVSDRTFRRYLIAYEAEGLDGLLDKRLSADSHRRAPVDEVMALTTLYRSHHVGWNVKHFYGFYKRKDGKRSYSWVKQTLQKEGVVKKGVRKGGHRKRRERAPIVGMLLHQDGSTHEWVPGTLWDLIVTMDDATSEHYSMFFVEEEGTQSSFRGMRETAEKKGLCCSLYTDRGSHYGWTPKEGGPVDKGQYTQFRRAMRQLGIEMIAAYSPEARGRSERAFGTHQGRLPKELALMGITTMEEANRYLREVYMPRFNEEFCVQASEEGSAFVPLGEVDLDEILCEQHERKVGRDNCVHFEGRVLQIPSDRYRCHYIGATVRVSLYGDGRVALFHGPRK